MGHQTMVNEQACFPETATKTLAQDVGDFALDVFTLAELQAQLLVVDVQECGHRVLMPSLALLAGGALGLACLPIALAALALWIIQAFATSYAAGFLVAVMLGAIVSGVLCVMGWWWFRQRLVILRRSQQELVRNLCWVKKVLARSRTTRGNRTDNSWRTVR